MRRRLAIGVTVAAVLAGAALTRSFFQAPRSLQLDETALHEYGGVYQWGPNAFIYLQLWNEVTPTRQLVAFDESGEVRALYATDRDRFFAGPVLLSRTQLNPESSFSAIVPEGSLR
jgi:hypothetical protein